MFTSSACQLCSAPHLYSKSNMEEVASVWDRQVSWQREQRDGGTSQGLSELLRNAITCVHISTAKASHGQANAKYSPSTGTGQINILAITQSMTVYKSITSNCQCPSLRILLRKTMVEHAKAVWSHS